MSNARTTYRIVFLWIGIILIMGMISAYVARAEDINRGRAIYMGNCAACHGEKGDGNGLQAGTSRPTNFIDPGVMRNLSDNDLQRVILQGKPGTEMRSYGTILTADELNDVIAFIRTLSSSSITGHTR